MIYRWRHQHKSQCLVITCKVWFCVIMALKNVNYLIDLLSKPVYNMRYASSIAGVQFNASDSGTKVSVHQYILQWLP